MNRPASGFGGIVFLLVVVALALAAFVRCDPSLDLVPSTVRRTDLTIAVEVAPDGAGEVEVVPAQTRFASGDEVSLVATAADGYVFDHWDGDADGMPISENPLAVTTTDDMTVTGVFVPATYEIATAVQGAGSVLVSGSEDSRAGTAVRFEAVADTGWVFDHWDGDLSGDSPSQEVTLSGPISATAVFARQRFAVTPEVVGAGTVEVTPEGPAEFESTIAINAVPDTGWAFSHWDGDTTGTSPAAELVVLDAVAVTAVFVRETYPVTATVEGSGTVAVTPSEDAPYESTVQLQAVAESGWLFDHWEGDAAGREPTLELVVMEAVDVTAVFEKPSHEVTTSAEGGGVVQVSAVGDGQDALPGQHQYESSVRLAAVPDTGWAFSHWEGDVTGIDSPVELTITGPTSVTAVFEQVIYELTTTTVGNGVVDTSAPGEIVYGSSVSLHAEPDPGWRFDRWEGDASGTDESIELTITGPVSATAVFVAEEVTILVYANGDNDLEFNLIEDLNEMEAADLEDSGLRVVALVDRSPFYDTSNGDWTGTRLYEIKNDPAGLNSLLVSKELPSPELGLTVGTVEELNLGSRSTLEAFLAWGKAAYPAPVEMLVIWGHGSGYRSGPQASVVGEAKEPTSPGSYRATAIDDSSGSDALYTAELGDALAASPVDIVGFDTCFGAQFEVYYQIAAGADYAVASQDLTPADGWDYQALLDRIAEAARATGGFLGAANVAVAVVEEYQKAHHTIPDASIAAFDIAHVPSVSAALDSLSDALYTATGGAARRDQLRDVIFSEVEDFYATPGDLSIDLGDLGRVVAAELDMADAEATALESAVRAAVLDTWHGEANPNGSGVSVHYVPLSPSGVPEVHHDSYFQGRSTAHPLEFVADSSWVPGSSGGGLLYRLWYEEVE